MIHFMAEILPFALITGLIWFVIGWWLSSLERAKIHHAREAEWSHHLNTLRRDRDSFRDEAEKAHGQIRILENRRADGKSPPRETELTDSERQKYKAIIKELHDNLETTERKMLGFSQHIENLDQQTRERDDVLETMKNKLTAATSTLNKRDQELEKLRLTTQQNFATHANQAELRDIVIAQEKTIANLQSNGGNGSAAINPQQEETIQSQSKLIQQLRRQLAQARDSKSAQNNESQAELRELVREQEFTISQLRGIAPTLPAGRVQEELEHMREAMQEQESVISQLRKVLEKSSRQSKLPAPPKPHIKEPAETPRSGDLFATMDENPLPDPHQEPSPPSGEANESGEKSDSISVSLFSSAPAHRDDLKKISGIGPAFERALNNLGIYQYSQIASCEEDDIDWIARKLHTFPDRIKKGKWIHQAQRLMTADQ